MKNSQIHFYIETELKDALELEAQQVGLSLSQYCRLKILEGSKLTRIELLLTNINSKLEGKNEK